MLSKTVQALLAASAVALAAPAFAQDTPPELSEASNALDAASSAGVIETLASGEAYTAFVPSNDALAAVQGEQTDQIMSDQAAFSNLILGYVVPGNVMASDAMSMVSDAGGSTTVDSLAGTPITLAMDGDTLTVNGAPVTTSDVMLGNVTVHVLGGAFLPESASQ